MKDPPSVFFKKPSDVVSLNVRCKRPTDGPPAMMLKDSTYVHIEMIKPKARDMIP